MISSPYQKYDLSDLCHIQIGKTPSRHNPLYWGNGHPWLSISDMDGADLRSTKEQITNIAVEKCGCKLIPENTLLMSFKLSIGKLGFTRYPMFTNEAIAALIIKDVQRLDSNYLYRALQAIDLSLGTDRAVMGATLNKEKLKKIRVPVPALTEQRHIAAILDKADAIRRKRTESLKLLDELLHTTFLDMFGDPITNSKSWPIVELSTILTSLTSGSRGWAAYYSNEGAKFLRIQNVGRNELLLGEIAYVNAPKNAEARRTQIKSGDILLSITADLGRTAVIPENFGEGYISQHLAKFSLQKADPLFISAFLASVGGQMQIARKNKGGTKAGLNFEDIKTLRIPMPPTGLQKRYSSFWHKIQKLKQLVTLHLSESGTIFHSLASRAFRGEL